MSQEYEHSHDHEHQHEGHDHEHEHEHEGHGHEHAHEHAVIVERMPAGTWKIDPHGSEVLFKAKMFGFLPMTGLFEEFAGELSADAAGGVGGRLVVQMASINSGWARRDGRLRSAAYFDVDKYPEMTFTLASIEPSGTDQMNLGGSLQIHHKSVPLNFPVYVIAHGDHLHLEGQVRVDHDVVGLGWSKPFFVGDRLRLETALTLVHA